MFARFPALICFAFFRVEDDMRVGEGGFTLIELLIVVAIIAILAAIAVPNFLEAQVRSKVSRAQADMRSIATALEAYFTGYNKYPPNPDTSLGFNITPWQLTTPEAFITTRPRDPFKNARNVAQDNNPALQHERFFYDYFRTITPEQYIHAAYSGRNVFLLSVDDGGGALPGANPGAFIKYGGWLQWSVGPDGLFWNKEDDFFGSAILKSPAYPPWGYSFDVPYDPTNGTNSFGNIIRTQVKSDGLVPYMP